VVNKADRDGADRAVAEVESVLGLHTYAEGEWRPAIIRTEATTGRGLDDLIRAIDGFASRRADIASRRRARAETQLRAILAARLMRQIESRVPAAEMAKLVDRMAARTVDPYSAADELLGETS
jgi:LAO/AO transport system kinase